MTGQLGFEIAPEALNQIEFRRIRRQKEQLEAVGILEPALAQRMALVIPRVIEHHDHRFVGGQLMREVVQKGQEGVCPFARTELEEDLPRSVVNGPKHDTLLVVAGSGNPQRLSPLAPDFCQVGMGVDLAFVEIDQMESLTALQIGSSGLSKAFFSSQLSTCLAAATAAAS